MRSKNNRFNRTERFIANLLNRLPFIKSIIKKSYQYLIWQLHKKKTQISINNFAPITFDNRTDSFFGYYDKSPVSDDYYILCHLSMHGTKKKPDPKRYVDIALFAPGKSQPLLKIQTHSYNWQQGARAHWLDSELFIFNDFDQSAQRYVSRVYSKGSLKEVKRFEMPVQDSFGVHYFLSINYRRLMALRPDYGYRNLPALDEDELSNLQNDGIWKVDYITGKTTLLYSLAQVASLDPKPEFANAFHKVNHVMISPSGDEFIFLHRFYLGRRRIDRLVLADGEGKNLRILADYAMVSHCYWADEKTIIGYLRGPADRDGYYLINTTSGVFTSFADGALDDFGDGHPHVRGDWFVTDTYPDKARMQHLLFCNWKTKQIRELGEVFHSFTYSGETRCDLHPRLSPDSRTVFFDSIFEGKRRLYRIDLG
jgi:hypothetical protein